MLMEQLSCLFPNEPALCRLIIGHLRRTVDWGGSYKEIKQGLPMGSALSPLLGAIYLSPLDALFADGKTVSINVSWTIGLLFNRSVMTCAKP